MYGRPDNRARSAPARGIRRPVPAPGSRLDRAGPLPLYYQLRQALLEEIRGGNLRAGDRLPTEADIGRRYGVSRATIRQALGQLEAEGVIHRIQGLGTFVATPKIRHVPLLTSFSELVASQGFVPSHRVLESSVAGAPPDVAAELGLADGAACRFLRRILFADGKPVGLAETWLPQDALGGHHELFEQGGLDGGSLYEVLQSEPLGLVLDHAVETISPTVADAATARLLSCRARTPVLEIRRVTFTPDGRPVESTHLRFVGDRYEYRVELHRPAAGRAA
jgi:GntR family transcriptional regulator